VSVNSGWMPELY